MDNKQRGEVRDARVRNPGGRERTTDDGRTARTVYGTVLSPQHASRLSSPKKHRVVDKKRFIQLRIADVSREILEMLRSSTMVSCSRTKCQTSQHLKDLFRYICNPQLNTESLCPT